MGSSYGLFRKKRFLPLFLAQFQEALTDNLIKNALIIIATYQIYVNSPSKSIIVVNMAALFLILPFFIFSSLAGQIADKFDKAIITRFIKGFEIFSMILAIYGFYSQNIIYLLITVFLLGLHSTFFGPIKYSILPQHLKKNELISGNAFIEAGTFIAILLGSIIGSEMPGIINSKDLSHGAIYVALLGVILAVFGFFISFYIPTAPSQEPDLKIDINIIRSTKNIINYSKKNKKVFKTILGVSWFWMIGMNFITAIPSFVKDTLHAQNSVFTLILVTFSIGIAIGSVACSKVQKDTLDMRYVPVGVFGMSVFMISLFVLAIGYSATTPHNALISLSYFLKSPYNWLIIIDILLIAAFGGFYVVPLNTLMQYWSDKKYMSRIIAANNIMNALFMAVGAIFFMLFINIGISIPFVILIFGILNLIVSFYIK